MTPKSGQPQLNRITVGTVDFDVSNLTDATARVISFATDGVAMPIRLSNAYCVALASRDEEYAALLKSEGINYPDGWPIVWFMRKYRNSFQSPGRVRGPSLFNEVLDKGRDANIRHFFLGTNPGTLDRLEQKVLKNYPGLEIAGSYAPPYGPLDSDFFERCLYEIKQTNAQLIWVALGTPKQDYATAKLAQLTRLPASGVGAAFDFAAGTAKEAPDALQKFGLEWAYRLFTEPKRLWRRYLIGNIQFLAAAVRTTRDVK